MATISDLPNYDSPTPKLQTAILKYINLQVPNLLKRQKTANKIINYSQIHSKPPGVGSGCRFFNVCICNLKLSGMITNQEKKYNS